MEDFSLVWFLNSCSAKAIIAVIFEYFAWTDFPLHKHICYSYITIHIFLSLRRSAAIFIFNFIYIILYHRFTLPIFLSIFFIFSSFYFVSVVGSLSGAIHIPWWKIVRVCPNTIQPFRACRERKRERERGKEGYSPSSTICMHTLQIQIITHL